MKRPIKKQSFESNRDVQRWLREQHDQHSPEGQFSPTFLASRRDSDWILSSLAVFHQQHLILDVISQASSGKEATVYCCVAHPDTGAELLAAKVYRPRMFRSLRNDAIYRESRATTDARGRAQRRERGQRSSNSHNERGRMLQVSSWIQSEYTVQRELHAAGADVPAALAQIGNAVLMGWIGDEHRPAPRLSDVDLDPVEAPALFEQLMRNIALFLANHRIHGDLSAYNILYWQGDITVIDFAQMVDPRYNPDVYPLLQRDIERVCSYFSGYGITADPATLAADLWARYMMGDLEVPNQ